MSGEGNDSLFNSDKDSLGEGWGKREDETPLAPIAWDKLPEAPTKKKQRARLATPAPGSNKESGLLDIKTLAPDLMKGKADQPDRGRPASSPAEPGGPRLATAAKASTAGSGLIDVGQLVKLQEDEKQARNPAPTPDPGGSSSTSGAAFDSMSSGLAASVSTNSGAMPQGDDVVTTGGGNRGLMIVAVVLLLAVAGLFVFVLTK